MEQLLFNQIKIKKGNGNERGEWLKMTSDKLEKDIKQIGSLTKGWNVAGLRSLYLSSESMARDKGLPFSQCWWWHYNQVKKELIL